MFMKKKESWIHKFDINLVLIKNVFSSLFSKIVT